MVDCHSSGKQEIMMALKRNFLQKKKKKQKDLKIMRKARAAASSWTGRSSRQAICCFRTLHPRTQHLIILRKTYFFWLVTKQQKQ